MRFVLVVVSIITLGTAVAFAQQPAETIGRLVDPKGRPIADVQIRVEGRPGSVRSDRAGRFAIRAAPGDTLIIELADGIAIADVTGDDLDDIVVRASETIAVNGSVSLEGGSVKLTREELARLPGTGGDLVRSLSVLPGVVSSPSQIGGSGVVIRGASPQDSKILIDDFEVPILFHDIGLRSIVPTEAIESLELVPGGFDVGHGRATSGIVTVTTRPGSERRSAQAELSVIDSGLLAQGAIRGRTRYMFALRRSHLDYLLKALVPDTAELGLTTVPRYWDEQLRIDHTLSSAWNLSFSSIGSDDVLEVFGGPDDAKEHRVYSHARFIRLTAAARYHRGPWTAKVALSGLAQQVDFGFGLLYFLRADRQTVTPRIEVARTFPALAGLSNVELRGGAEAVVGRNSLVSAFPEEQREGEPPPTNDDPMPFDGVVWTPDIAAWNSLSANLDPKIRVTAGLRADAFARSGEVAIQPRGELAIRVAKPWLVRFSAGAYRRPPEHADELRDRDLRSEHATHLIAGAQFDPNETLRVQSSIYYIDRTSLITRDLTGALDNLGRGRTYGAELLATLRRGPWFGLVSYAYSHSTRVDAPGEMPRLFDYDQPHSLNLVASWKRGKWQVGGRFRLYSGLPRTPVLGAVFDSDRDAYLPSYGAVNSERGEMHHQLDLRIDRTWRIGPASLTGFLDLQNAYFQRTAVDVQYSFDYATRQRIKTLPLIPSLGLRGVL